MDVLCLLDPRAMTNLGINFVIETSGNHIRYIKKKHILGLLCPTDNGNFNKKYTTLESLHQEIDIYIRVFKIVMIRNFR